MVGGWEGTGLLRLGSQSLLILFLRIVVLLLAPQGEHPLRPRDLGGHTADLPDTSFPQALHFSRPRGTHAVGSCLATARRKSGLQDATVGFSSPLCSPVWFQKFTMHCPIPLTGSAALGPELHGGPAPLLGAPRAASWGAVGLWGGQPHARLFPDPPGFLWG